MVEADECKADENQGLGFPRDCSSADRKRVSGPTRRSTKGFWTNEKDQVLAFAVKKYNGKNWKKIAEYVNGMTDVQCLHRWQKVLDPSLVKGPWTKEEDDKIIELVEKQGNKKWAEVAKSLPGRIGKQCRERWHNHLNPAINKAPWTTEEELILTHAHQKYGNKWAEIAKLLTGRTENSIKNHWNCSLKRRLDLNASAVHPPGSPTNNIYGLKMERQTENVIAQFVRRSLGTTFSLDRKMESQSSVGTDLGLAIGYSSGRQDPLQPFNKENRPLLEKTGVKQPSQITFEKKEAPECDLVSGFRDSAVNNKLSLEAHINSNKLKESCGISLDYPLTFRHSATLGDHTPPAPNSGCIPPLSNSPLDEIGCNGKTSSLSRKVDVPVSARRSLQAPKGTCISLTTYSWHRDQAKNHFPSMQTHEIHGTNEETGKFLNVEDKSLSGLCCEPLSLEGQRISLQSATLPVSDSYIEQPSSPVSSCSPASNDKRSSVSCGSPESILRSAARSYRNTPSIIRKRNRTPSDPNKNDGSGTEKIGSEFLPKAKQLFLSPLKSQKLDTFFGVKRVENFLEHAFNKEQD